MLKLPFLERGRKMPHEEEYVVSNPNKDELPLEVPKEEITVQQILDRGSFGVIKFGI